MTPLYSYNEDFNDNFSSTGLPINILHVWIHIFLTYVRNTSIYCRKNLIGIYLRLSHQDDHLKSGVDGAPKPIMASIIHVNTSQYTCNVMSRLKNSQLYSIQHIIGKHCIGSSRRSSNRCLTLNNTSIN